MAFNTATGAGDSTGILPVEFVRDLITETEKTSVVLKRGARRNVSTSALEFPILSLDGQAAWVNGVNGRKPLAEVNMDLARIRVEEMALIVPVADSIVADGGPNLDREILAKIKESFAVLLDGTVLFGLNKPSSFPIGLVPGAIAAGNVTQVTNDANGKPDLIGAMLGANGSLIGDGFKPTGVVGSALTSYQLLTTRDSAGNFQFPGLTNGNLSTFVGSAPLDEAAYWDDAIAQSLSVDWSKVVVAMREDVTYTISNQATLTAPDGTVRYNLFQQDMSAIRVVMRIGYGLAVNPGELTTKFPAAVVTPAA